MKIIKTSTHVLCLSTPFKSSRILQDAKSEQVNQTLPWMYSALLEHGKRKHRLKVTYTNDSKIPLVTLVSLHCWGQHSGPCLVWLGPDYANNFLLPPVPSLLSFFSHLLSLANPHNCAKNLIQLKTFLGRKRSRDNASQQELPAIRLV